VSTTSDITTHTARKRHKCDWCAHYILPSEKYARYRWWDGSDAGTCKMHPECKKAMNEHAAEEGGWVEFEPVDNPFGCWCGFDADCNNPLCVARMAAETEPGDGREGEK